MGAISLLEARQEETKAKYHDIHCPADTRSEGIPHILNFANF